MSKENKKLVIALVLLILFLVIIISILSNIISKSDNKRNNNNDNNINNYQDEDITIKYNEDKGKYKPNVINSEYNRLNNEQITAIDNLIDKILGYINEKDYTSLFEMIEVNYKNIRFVNEKGENDIESFKNTIDDLFCKEKYECLTYRLENDICYVYFMDSELINAEEKNRYDALEVKIIGYSNPDTAKISFEDMKIKTINSSFIVSGLIINLKYLIEYDTFSTVFMNVYNANKNDINLDIEKFNLVVSMSRNETTYSSNDKITRKINANTAINIELTMKDKIESIYLPNEVEYLIKIDGKELEGTKLIQDSASEEE